MFLSSSRCPLFLAGAAARWVRHQPMTHFCGVNGRVLTVHLVNWKSESRPMCPGPPGDWPPSPGRAMALIITETAKKTAVKNNFMFNACSVWCSVPAPSRFEPRVLTVLRWVFGIWCLRSELTAFIASYPTLYLDFCQCPRAPHISLPRSSRFGNSELNDHMEQGCPELRRTSRY